MGFAILHPVTTLVYWYEFGASNTAAQSNALTFLLDRLSSAFAFEMLTMSAVYVALGAAIGLGFGIYHSRLLYERSKVRFLERELEEELPLLIARGEGEHVEFKSSMRWDRREERVNRHLQQVVVKTIAGFLNHEGGTLLIGVEDDGTVAGIEADMRTLKHTNQDGFERLLMDTARDALGGDSCALVHSRFHGLGGLTVCRVIVEKSVHPVYYTEGGVAHLMLRTGNSTRELDVREAQAHLQRREARPK
jgi:hypothetical protein